MQLVNPFAFAAAIKEWQFIASTNSQSSTITLPSSINAGDLLIIFNVCADDDGGAPALVTPSGFTNKINETVLRLATAGRIAVHVKKASGTEDSTSVTCMNSTWKTVICLQFRPVNFTISSVANLTIGNLAIQEYYGNPASASSVATGVKLPAIAFGQVSSYSRSGGVAFTTQSPTFDATFIPSVSSDTFQQTVGYRIENEVVSTQTIDMSDNGQMNFQQVFHLYDNGL